MYKFRGKRGRGEAVHVTARLESCRPGKWEAGGNAEDLFIRPLTPDSALCPCCPDKHVSANPLFVWRNSEVSANAAGDRTSVQLASVFRLLSDPGFVPMALSPFPAKLAGWSLLNPLFFRCPFFPIFSPGADSPIHPSDERFIPLSTGWAHSNTHSLPRGRPRTHFIRERLFFR